MNHTTNKGIWCKFYASEIQDADWLLDYPERAAAYLCLLADATANNGVVDLSKTRARDYFASRQGWRTFLDKFTQYGYGVLETRHVSGKRGRTSFLTFSDWESKQALSKNNQDPPINLTKTPYIKQPKTLPSSSNKLSVPNHQINQDPPTRPNQDPIVKGVFSDDAYTSLRFLEIREKEIRENKKPLSPSGDVALPQKKAKASASKADLTTLMNTYNAHRGGLPQARSIRVGSERERLLKAHLRSYEGDLEAAQNALIEATEGAAMRDFYVTGKHGIEAVLRHLDANADLWDAAVSGKPTIEKGVWWRVLWPDSDGVEREQPALVKERVSDGLFSVAIITNEHIRTYEEGQKFTKVTTLGEAKFITPYGGTPPCVERVKADEKAKKATRSTTPQGVAHAGD